MDDVSSKPKRGTRIPENFTVTPEMVTWARENCPNVDSRYETEQFIDYWMSKPGKQAVKLDWVRTWKQWFRKSQRDAEDRQHRAAANRRPTQDEKVANLLSQAGMSMDDFMGGSAVTEIEQARKQLTTGGPQ